jgi:hypothetical protein
MKLVSLALLLLVVLIATPPVAAGENWLCVEAGTVWRGDQIVSCGVGEAAREADARAEALDDAYRELRVVCANSARCRGRALDAVPLRTDCREPEPGRYVCYRGVRAAILGAPRADLPSEPPGATGFDPDASWGPAHAQGVPNGIARQLETFSELNALTESVAKTMSRSFY